MKVATISDGKLWLDFGDAGSIVGAFSRASAQSTRPAALLFGPC